jgi:very-short-patch-repair endonuclease
MLWREQGLVVELDGLDAHSTPAQLAADAERQRWLEAQGLAVIRFGWDDVHAAEERTMAVVRTWLARLRKSRTLNTGVGERVRNHDRDQGTVG